MSVQDRPKLYMSQNEGASLNTFPSIDQNSVNPVVISPMITSKSNSTFESSIDLSGSNTYQVQGIAQAQLNRSKSNSGGSLSALGSIDSFQGDYAQYVQVNPQQVIMG